MKDIRYSLIIPHYNIPDLLERCLRSVPERNDLQTIVVDDHSPENCKEALHRIENLFPHVSFVYCETNGGAGKARNIGMEKAEGRYLIFADADDYFSEEFPTILDRCKGSTEDIIFFRYIGVLESLSSKDFNQNIWGNEIMDRYFKTHIEDELRCSLIQPWGRFYKRTFIQENNLYFEEIPFSNDYYFVVSAGCKAGQIKVEDCVLYYYVRRDGSLTSSYNKKPNELEIRAAACFRGQKIMKQYGYKFHFMPMTSFLSTMFHTNKKLYRHYLKMAHEVYSSKWDAVKQVVWWENGWLPKLKIHAYTIFC